jgi:hypothetical protein
MMIEGCNVGLTSPGATWGIRGWLAERASASGAIPASGFSEATTFDHTKNDKMNTK